MSEGAVAFLLQVDGAVLTITLMNGAAFPVPATLTMPQIFNVTPAFGAVTTSTNPTPASPGIVTIVAGQTQGQATFVQTSSEFQSSGITAATIAPGVGPLSAVASQTCVMSIDPGDVVVSNMCVTNYTRPYYRDAIRRKLSVTPPIDTMPNGLPGEEPAGQAWPSNPLINDAISNAIREINRDCRYFTMTNINIPVTAEGPTFQGAQWISLAGIAGQSGQNVVQKILRVVWNDGAGTIYTLIPENWRSFDRGRFQFDTLFPSSPRWYIMEAYQIGILPALSTNGTLMVWAGTGITNFCSDTDTLNQLPIDYQEVIEDLAVLKLNKSNPDKPMSKEQIALFMQSAKEGKDAIIKWASTISGLQQSNITFESDRMYRVH